MKIAARLGMSLQRTKQETTSSEYVLWLAFFQWEVNDFHREDYFLGRIAMFLEIAVAKEPGKVTFDSQLLKFVSKDEAKKPDSPLSAEEKLMRSKSSWAMVLGQPPDGKEE